MGHTVGTKEHHCPVAGLQAIDGGADIISHYNLLGGEMTMCGKKTRQQLRLRNWKKGDPSPEIDSIYGLRFPSKAGVVAEFWKGHV